MKRFHTLILSTILVLSMLAVACGTLKVEPLQVKKTCKCKAITGPVISIPYKGSRFDIMVPPGILDEDLKVIMYAKQFPMGGPLHCVEVWPLRIYVVETWDRLLEKITPVIVYYEDRYAEKLTNWKYIECKRCGKVKLIECSPKEAYEILFYWKWKSKEGEVG